MARHKQGRVDTRLKGSLHAASRGAGSPPGGVLPEVLDGLRHELAHAAGFADDAIDDPELQRLLRPQKLLSVRLHLDGLHALARVLGVLLVHELELPVQLRGRDVHLHEGALSTPHWLDHHEPSVRHRVPLALVSRSQHKRRVVRHRAKCYRADRRLHRVHDVNDSCYVVNAASWTVHVEFDLLGVVHVFQRHQGPDNLRRQHVVKIPSDEDNAVLEKVRHHIHAPFFSHGNDWLNERVP
mmetsp:Transcript_13183/g.34070  ORF Transcript_13183/g.34070 Transcript_13183/m.34070 type:complete len:240 (-) Transcript_13183:179-898(-)